MTDPLLKDATSAPMEIAADRRVEWAVDRDFLLKTVVCDLHSCAMQVAMLAIMLAACARPEGAAAVRSARHLLQDGGKMMELALLYGAEIGMPAAAVDRIGAFYRGVTDAKLALWPLIPASLRSARPNDLLLKCSRTWRRLAGAASEALGTVDALTRSKLDNLYVEDAVTLRQLLKEAADGDIRRVDATGTIRLPPLRQRHQNPRAAVRQTCTIVTTDGSHAARITDVSRDGLGIVSSYASADRQALAVVLDDGRRLEATVARRQGDHIGLSLSAPLSSDDPLFSPRRRD